MASDSNFYIDVIQQDSRFHTLESIRDIGLLEPVTRTIATALLAEAKNQGIELLVTETYRSKERQQLLFTKGATHLKEVGVHHYGLAFDVCKIIDGKASWAGDWAFLGRLAIAHGLVWGGDWGEPTIVHSFRDFDHVQRCSLGLQDMLFLNAWYPDLNYLPIANRLS